MVYSYEAAPRCTVTGWGAVFAVLAGVWPFAFYQWKPDAEHVQAVIVAVQIASIVLMIASMVTLRSNFSVIPDYRALVRKGPYRLVRHPLYAAYLLFDGAMAYQAHSLLAVAFWLAECAIFHARTIFEERLLRRVEAHYTEYCRRVRYLSFRSSYKAG
jgi:protein-S-isoprenylcysteine O-methyltransferase Ste14